MTEHLVQLYVYDLSAGQAKANSMKMAREQINGVWSTSIVVYGKEFYFGKGICYDLPGHTPQGKPTSIENLGHTEFPEDTFNEIL